MTTLRLTGHHNRAAKPGVAICEILDPAGRVIGAIYPTDLGVKVISVLLEDRVLDQTILEYDPSPPVGAMHVNLLPAAAGAHETGSAPPAPHGPQHAC